LPINNNIIIYANFRYTYSVTVTHSVPQDVKQFAFLATVQKEKIIRLENVVHCCGENEDHGFETKWDRKVYAIS
jgi:hypothetical protein